MRVLVDMDGVLVDLLTGWCEFKGLSIPDPYPLGTMRFDKLFAIEQKNVWKGCEARFWATLPKMPDASLLMSDLEFLFGFKHVFPITSIIGPPIAAAGKIEWLLRNFPTFYGSYFITNQRNQLANQETILIDDDENHILEFKRAGGHAVLVPRIWNSAYHSAHESILLVMGEVARLARAERYLRKSG
jgi:5'(3')-deoxyribonucleotidase